MCKTRLPLLVRVDAIGEPLEACPQRRERLGKPIPLARDGAATLILIDDCAARRLQRIALQAGILFVRREPCIADFQFDIFDTPLWELQERVYQHLMGGDLLRQNLFVAEMPRRGMHGAGL
jgi:hypothetical protein